MIVTLRNTFKHMPERQSRVAYHSCYTASFLAAVLGSTGLAAAQSRYVGLSVSSQFDDNLRRLPDDRKATVPQNGREISTVVSADAGVTAVFSLLNVSVDGRLAKRFFAYNDELDNEEYRLSATADYEAQSGSATFEALISRENLGFSDPIFRGTNIRDLQRFTAEGNRRIIGDIRLAASGRFTSSSSPDRLLSRADNNSYGYAVGLSYVSPLNNRIEVGYNENRSESTVERSTVIDDGIIPFTGDSVGRGAYLRLAYAPSVPINLNARVGYTWQDDRTILDADFKGITYSGSVSWTPLESVSIVASADRSFSSNNELFANGVQSSSYSLQANAVAAGRVTLNASIRHDERNFRYDLQDALPAISPRTDRFLVVGAGAEYMTGIGVAVGLNINHIRISDNAISETITNNAVILTLGRRFNL